MKPVRVDAWLVLGSSAVGGLFSVPPILALLQKIPGYVLILVLSFWPGSFAACILAVLLLCWHSFGMLIWSRKTLALEEREGVGNPITYQELREQHFIFWSSLIGVLLYAVLLAFIAFGDNPLYVHMGL